MEKIKSSIKKLILLLINCCVLILTFFIPKTDRIIIVGGWFGERFADNSKHFFLNVFNNKYKLNISKIIWITRDEQVFKELRENGFLVFKVWSLLGIWYHLRAKYHVIDQTLSDINPFFSVRSKRINLWHGFPLKKIGIYMKNNHIRKPQYGTLKWTIDKITFKGCWFDYYLLATSEFSAEIIGRAFEISKERIIISGYPRNYEPFIENPFIFITENERIYRNRIQGFIDKGYKAVGYFPTFRDKKETLIFGTKDLKELNKFLDFCEKSKLKVVGKFHFAGKKDSFNGADEHDAFINLPSDADVYTFLSQIDILITDYSSIYYDFLLWKKPIIFFPYDLEYFKNEDRGFIYDYDDFTPGDKVVNCAQLQSLLVDGVDSYSKMYFTRYKDKANKVARKIFVDYENMGIEHLISQIRK
ncbi:CDP-glycerol glycerophosphotransferase family protein [Halocella sp. SP3-1]|uniref:CDP-glycerol glycerophosphotransferase family protein n=1 Tax=Halocella sp. SP3-1 TaxID=2382161 RepID=UPI00197AFF07|nr:CDP-glycerol glycerophosphotransferase family protein [Halocella sp. SP3-1]